MKRNRFFRGILIVVLIAGALLLWPSDPSTTFSKGQEVEYINYCYKLEPENQVKESLAVISYEKYEIFVYLSAQENIRVSLLTENRHAIEEWESCTPDLEKIVDSNNYISMSRFGKNEHFEITL